MPALPAQTHSAGCIRQREDLDGVLGGWLQRLVCRSLPVPSQAAHQADRSRGTYVFETILVAIDHSGHSQHALFTAKDLAKCTGSKVRIVHVREVSVGRKSPPVSTEFSEEANALVEDAVKAVTADGIAATGVVRHTHAGRVASEILQEAADSGASLIVLGARGLTDLEGLVMGSTTHKVLHLGTLPVLVMR
jgi:nucleotide-binding universal stress UspA family protein